jgi:hypothetical protein
MEKIAFAIIILFCFSLSAQSPIININSTGHREIVNAYYKDIDNFQNQFVGTWVYTDATKTIRFKFVKKEMFYYQSVTNYYADYLIGEMQYIENGVEKINSLMNLNINQTSIFTYSLHSYGKVYNDAYPKCLECPDDVQRMAMSYSEPTNDDVGLAAAFVMRRADENGVQKIKIQYILTNGPAGLKSDFETPSSTTNFTIPYGDFTLLKEN